MRIASAARLLLVSFAVLAPLSCGEGPTAPTGESAVAASARRFGLVAPDIVISQVYGGGGNSGATYKSDFVELFNPGTSPVSLTGWSVQYASATGTSWAVTALSGSIPAGGYYLIRQANGTGGTVDLPTPDATGSVAMAAGAGKVALSRMTTAFSGTCPAVGNLVDVVSFGSTATPCGFGVTPAPSNTNAVLRQNNGCTYTGNLASDFVAALPTPRNAASAPNACTAPPAIPATVTVSPATVNLITGGAQALTASAVDASSNPVATTFIWTSSNTSVATVNASGVVTAVAAGSATITATTPSSISGSAAITVTDPPVVIVTADLRLSQVYGGGGNSGATYSNDFIEIFNFGTTPVDVAGWSVHYASAAGTNWSSTPLTGTIQPGGYLLVQGAAGATPSTALPAPDVIGSLSMGGTAGKVLLTAPGITPVGACPTGPGVVDRIGYGSGTDPNGCVTAWNGRTSNLTSSTAAFRSNDGCVATGTVAVDWTVLPPNPRNSASAIKNCTQPARPQSSATLVINELMGDPANAESASWGEWFEVHNYGATPVDLQGWTIISSGTSQPNHVIGTSLIVPAGGYAVLGRGNNAARNGGVTLDYNYYTGSATTIWLDNADYLMLVDAAGARVDSVAWTALPRGVTKGLRSAATPHANVDGAEWGYSTVNFGDGDYGTPGAPNGTLDTTAPYVPANTITVSGRVASDVPLPVGFEAQLFATELDPAGVTVPTTFTWSSLTPSVASVDARGVIRALAAGTARFRVASADGAVRVHALEMVTPVASTTAQYGDNTSFGDPVDADPSDDFIIRRPQYTTSYNVNRGIPNWVAYDLNSTHIQSGQDRCNCFTFDPQLPAAFPRYTTADYTGAGAYAGYGIDRGHLVRSFDRTTGTLDNAYTFYFSNVVPQAADMNQGPWAIMENYLGDLATSQNREVYIYAGPAGNKGTVKGEGLITIPAYTWKVALVMPRAATASDVQDYRDVQVIAVVMPNEPGVRNVPWQTYQVTVDSIQRLTGYDLLSALAARTQRALESDTKPPLASLDGPYTGDEGTAIAMSAAASVDPNGSIVSHAWSFGDGTFSAGASSSHTYAHFGSYTVRLIVTDNDGLADTVSTTVQVANVAPTLGAISAPTAAQSVNATVGISAPFTDAGTGNVHTASVTWGDGTSGSATVVETGGIGTLSASHTYATPGLYTVNVTVTDDGGLTAARNSNYVVVVDAAGASLTGGGWIESPVASCALTAACTAASGKSQFQLNVKYDKRGSLAGSVVQFKFDGAGIDFDAKSVTWMASTDRVAFVAGTGTVNKQAGYSFLLSVADGDAVAGDGTDRLRLRVWNTTTSAMVYDSQDGTALDAAPVTALGQGSIVIHAK